MMMNGMTDGPMMCNSTMMIGMGLAGLLLVTTFVLTAFCAVKYLRA